MEQPGAANFSRDKHVRDAIVRDRRCARWFEYQPSRSPKEHLERFEMLQLEKDRADLQVRLADMEREARRSSEKIQADSLEIGKTLASVATSTDRFQRRWARAAVGLAVAALIVVAGAWIFPDLGRHIGQWLDQVLGYPLGRG
jgi:hypothetical protein